MIVKVEMQAFAPGKVREVFVPDEEWGRADNTTRRLERVFRYGQNDFQPQPLPSVSVGDVVVIDDRRFVCAPMGWRELLDGEQSLGAVGEMTR